MNRRLTLICHAATTATRAAAFPADEGIEPAAQALAAALAPRLGRVDRAWVSPARAARETAAALGLDAAPEPALRDCDVGRWTGRRLTDVQAEDAPGVAAWLADAEAAPHGGEPRTAVFARVAGWLAARVTERGHVVAVTHASVMRAAVLAVLDAPASAFWRIDVPPLAIIALGSDGRRWNLRAAGQT
ncbi:MAG TPA: histidine phosphatase family protein [Xanthobacteraceae bacterium]|nr:histidine phosphatase family protein [Xanthobacteraceae bacterium]